MPIIEGRKGYGHIYSVEFDFNSATNVILENLKTGHLIESVTIRVIIPFDGGATIDVGFPANQTEIVDTLALDVAGDFEYEVDRISTIVESLRMYFSNLATVGEGVIFVKGQRK